MGFYVLKRLAPIKGEALNYKVTREIDSEDISEFMGPQIWILMRNSIVTGADGYVVNYESYKNKYAGDSTVPRPYHNILKAIDNYQLSKKLKNFIDE